MKRSLTLGLAGCCAVFGAVRWLDLIFFTDPATGFSTALPDLLRYLLLAAAVVGLFLPGLRISPAAHFRPGASCAVGAILTGLVYLSTALMQYSGHLSLEHGVAAAVLLIPLSILLGGWLTLLGVLWFPGKAALIPLPLGIAATLYYLFQTFLNGLTDAAHLAHLGIVWRALGYMMALWFSIKLLRAVCLPGETDHAGLWSAGLAVFLLGTCLQLPQAIWWVWVGYQSYTVLPAALGMGLTGLLGLLCALHITPEEE